MFPGLQGVPLPGDVAGVIHNTGALPDAQLPKSIMDLAGPEWKGRFAVSPSGADFQAIVSAVYALRGDEAGAAWLQGVKDNAKVLRGNNTVMKAVNAGEVQAGVIHHYCWSGDRADDGADSKNTELVYFGGQDPGAGAPAPRT